MTDQLNLGTLHAVTKRRTLASLGFQPHDVITLTTNDRDHHIELA